MGLGKPLPANGKLCVKDKTGKGIKRPWRLAAVPSAQLGNEKNQPGLPEVRNYGGQGDRVNCAGEPEQARDAEIPGSFKVSLLSPECTFYRQF